MKHKEEEPKALVNYLSTLEWVARAWMEEVDFTWF
jgi:hypothetical protein